MPRLFLGFVAAWLLCLSLTIQPGHVKRVYDADTFFLYDVNPRGEEGVRVEGVQALELGAPGGPAARAFTQAWLRQGPFELTWCKREKFGRLLAEVERQGENLATALIAAGHGIVCETSAKCRP